MVVRVEPVARLRGEVDPADERDAVVDDDRLLVMAVHRPLLRVESALNLRVLGQPVAHRRDISPRGAEERKRRPGPDEHAHVEPLGQFGEEVPKDERVAITALERERRSEVPPGDVDVRLRAAQRVDHRRQRLRAVDQNLDAVAGSRRKLPGGPLARLGMESVRPPDPLQSPPVMTADLFGDLFTHPTLERKGHPPERIKPSDHRQILRYRASLNEKSANAINPTATTPRRYGP